MDVQRGTLRAGSPGLHGGGDERSGSPPGCSGLHRDTVRKMLAYSVPPGYWRPYPPRRPKLAPFTRVIDAILEADRQVPRKQRQGVSRGYSPQASPVRRTGIRSGAELKCLLYRCDAVRDRFMLPDPHNRPACLSQRLGVSCIPFDVSLQFWLASMKHSIWESSHVDGNYARSNRRRRPPLAYE